jgi:hypothetical protein
MILMEGKMDEKSTLTTSIPLTQDELKARTKISEDFYSIFSNQVRIAASPAEFRLFFGENYPAASGEIEVVEILSVVLTPAQAKNLSVNLSTIIEKYEEMSGQIPVPPTLPLAATSLPSTPATEPKE